MSLEHTPVLDFLFFPEPEDGPLLDDELPVEDEEKSEPELLPPSLEEELLDDSLDELLDEESSLNEEDMGIRPRCHVSAIHQRSRHVTKIRPAARWNAKRLI